MKRRAALFTIVAALMMLGATVIPAGAGPGHSASKANERLLMYVVVADQAGAKAIKAGGYDVASV